jgi:hypothetical protein
VESEIQRIQVGASDSYSYLSVVKCAQGAQKGNEQGERRLSLRRRDMNSCEVDLPLSRSISGLDETLKAVRNLLNIKKGDQGS